MKLLLISKAEQVAILRGVLEKEGIATHVTDGGTPLPGAEFYPKLWVVNDAHFERASAVLRDFHRAPSGVRMAWRCPGCGEQVEAQFSSCWNCGREHPEGPLTPLEPEPVREPPSRKQIFANFLGATVLLLVAAASVWQLLIGRTHIALYEFQGTGRVLDVYFPFLAVLTLVLGASLLWRALGLRHRRLRGEHEPTA